MKTLLDAVAKLAKTYTQNMEYVCTIKAGERNIRYNSKRGRHGIYAFYPKGTKDVPVYLGETTNCLNSRISNHKKSLHEPEWISEITGKKFIKYNIDRAQQFDVYFIEYTDEISKYDSRTLEGIFKLVLNPIVFE